MFMFPAKVPKIIIINTLIPRNILILLISSAN
jgi:hypothetical protein